MKMIFLQFEGLMAKVHYRLLTQTMEGMQYLQQNAIGLSL